MRNKMTGTGVLIGLLALAGPAVALGAETGAAPGQEPKTAAAQTASKAAATPAPAAAAGQKAPGAGQDAAAQPGAQKPAKASHPVQGSPAVTATEQRYQQYLDKEKAASDAALAKQRSKLEDKYKGFVRTVKPKQGSKNDTKKGAE